MCGEHGTPFSSSLSLMGSSPHVRGARRDMDPVQPAAGIIPACAGSTPRNLLLVSAPWDHPRMCGEHATPRTDTPDSTGIIPACAGSTSVCFLGKFLVGDHPRMCGEHRSIVGIGVACQGSSPHVRGARRPRQPGIRPNGIIPACAGSTQVRLRRRPWTEDHPRMCGEHDAVPELSACDSGSSPHVRGALSCRNCLRLDCGIIPACAGSTSAVRPSIMVATDHPRMCGEHLEPSPVQNSTAGSSPHVRGAPHHIDHGATQLGIIPACAGSTLRK